jgi:CRP-like cAMP-binding protein
MNASEAIQASYLTTGLSKEDVELLSGVAEVRHITRDTEIIRHGDTSGDVFVLVDGRASVLTATGDSVAEPEPGAVVGEIALLDYGPRTATVVARAGATVAVLPERRLRTLMGEHPSLELGLLRNLARALCAKMRASASELERFHFMLG